MRMDWDKSYRDKKITDNVLPPLIFENKRLVGWRREFAVRSGLI